MSCDLSHPDIQKAYEAVQDPNNSRVNLVVLGYAGTRDKLFVSFVGAGTPAELGEHLIPGEVHFGLLSLEGRLLLFNWLPEGAVSGVRRARALVHSRAVAGSFSVHGSISASRLSDLNESAVRSRLKLDGTTSLPPSPAPHSPSSFPSTPFQALYAPTSSPPHNKPVTEIPTHSRALTPTHQHQRSPSNTPSSHRLPTDSPGRSSLPSSPRMRNISPVPRTGSPTSRHVSSVPPSPNLLSDGFHPRDTAPESDYSHDGTFGQHSAASRDQDAIEAERLQHESMRREEAIRLEREATETAARASEEFELEARARSEREKAEASRLLDLEDQKRLEEEEAERREAADRLRREEERRLEMEAKERERVAEEEKRREEEGRMLIAREEARLMVQRNETMERLRKEELALKDQEDLKRKAEEKIAAKDNLLKRLETLRIGNEIMLEGSVSVQGGDSIMFRRRWFELRGESLTLFKEKSAPKPIDTIALSKHVKIKDVEPDESLPLNAFHLALTSDEDSDYLFYTDDSEDKEILVAALKMASGLS